jgi:hypothetical protein
MKIHRTTTNQAISLSGESTRRARLLAVTWELPRCQEIRQLTPAQGSLTSLSSVSQEPNDELPDWCRWASGAAGPPARRAGQPLVSRLADLSQKEAIWDFSLN